MPARDIIVIAGSAGAVQGLRALVAALPASLPAAVFIVLHTSSEGPGLLAQLLNSHSLMPVTNAVNNERIQHGHVYVAPPDHHLLLSEGHILLGKGPRENGFRPAADPLFRTAAQIYGPRVVGVVLSGGMDDGTLGMKSIKGRGGVVVVQVPSQTLHPGMAESVLRHVAVDYVLPVGQMAELLAQLAHDQGLNGVARMKRPGSSHAKSARDPAKKGDLALPHKDLKGPPSSFICPECGGSLWEQQDNGLLHYRCHVGHAFTSGALSQQLDSKVEEALWTALRVLEETAGFRRRLAIDARERRLSAIAATYEERADDFDKRAAVIRKVLLQDEVRAPKNGVPRAPSRLLSRTARKSTKKRKRLK